MGLAVIVLLPNISLWVFLLPLRCHTTVDVTPSSCFCLGWFSWEFSSFLIKLFQLYFSFLSLFLHFPRISELIPCLVLSSTFFSLAYFILLNCNALPCQTWSSMSAYLCFLSSHGQCVCSSPSCLFSVLHVYCLQLNRPSAHPLFLLCGPRWLGSCQEWVSTQWQACYLPIQCDGWSPNSWSCLDRLVSEFVELLQPFLATPPFVGHLVWEPLSTCYLSASAVVALLLPCNILWNIGT